MQSERHIVVSIDLESVPGDINVDIGTLSPHVAYAALCQALEALEDHGPIVTVVRNGERLEEQET